MLHVHPWDVLTRTKPQNSTVFAADVPLKVKQTSDRLPMVTMVHLCPLTVIHIKWTYILISPITRVI